MYSTTSVLFFSILSLFLILRVMKIENTVHLIWQVVSTLLLALMATKYIIGSVAASFAFAYVCGVYVADRKVLGGEVPIMPTNFSAVEEEALDITAALSAGTTPRTVATNEWWQETDKKFQAWPRTAGPPVAMKPIRRHNFIVKSSE
jgi:hypothetical protein